MPSPTGVLVRTRNSVQPGALKCTEGQFQSFDQRRRLALQIGKQDRAGIGLVDPVALVGVDRLDRVVEHGAVALVLEDGACDQRLVREHGVDNRFGRAQRFSFAFGHIDADAVEAGVYNGSALAVRLYAARWRIECSKPVGSVECLDGQESVARENRHEIRVGLGPDVAFDPDPFGLAARALHEHLALTAGSLADLTAAIQQNSCIIQGERRTMRGRLRLPFLVIDPKSQVRAREINRLQKASRASVFDKPIVAGREEPASHQKKGGTGYGNPMPPAMRPVTYQYSLSPN